MSRPRWLRRISVGSSMTRFCSKWYGASGLVLSACNTGLGEIRTGEGVFGLRRAFVLAGAKTLVMSLWKVPDEETRELMEDFYRRILAGEPRAEALRNAQRTMKTKYPQAFFWGAFICQGNPGPHPPGGGGTTALKERKDTAPLRTRN